MKPIPPRPIFCLSFFTTLNHKIIKNSRYLAFSTQTHQNPVSSHHQRRHEDESRRVRVSVWWDFENCNLPLNTNVFTVGQRITNALRANGIKGPIQITAFGDVMQISRTNLEALSSSGIILSHVPSGGKNSADRSLLVDLMYWVSNNPPPAHLFLISGDRDFAGILHRLRMNNYNILLAGPDNAPSVLCSAATIMWQWSSLLKGEDVTGRFFNYPPDGPYNSWYGHYNAPLEDPFAVKEQPSCLPADELCRPIPREVMKYIRQILNSYPEGIPISRLRTELDRSNLSIDRDFYGYKKFSRFLSAMPHIVRLDFGIDSMIFARGANFKFVDESVPATKSESSVNNEEFEDVTEKTTVSAPKVKAQPTYMQEFQNEEKSNESTSSMSMQGMKVKAQETNLQDLKKEEKQKESLPNRKMQEAREQDRNIKLQEQQKKGEVASPIVEIKETSERKGIPDIPPRSSELGMLKRIWMKLFGSGKTNSSDKSGKKSDGTLGGKDSIEEKNPMSQLPEFARPASLSPSSDEALIGGKTAKSDDAVADVSSHGSGFNWIMSRFKSWSSSKFDDKIEKNAETVDQVKVSPEQLDIFSRESFWKEVEWFLDTSDGAATFLQSRTREQLGQNLQKHGPPVLKSLPEGNLLHLIDLLIKDKKWVEECHSQTFPFKLTRPTVGKDPHDNPPLSSNGLSHIFARRWANLPDPGGRKHQNPPHTGFPQPIAHRGSSSKPKSEMLADCQKVIDHIVKEYPEGFNMGCFRKLFLEKHGYALDLRKLGYEKLVNLLQIMPGVRVESSLILPAAAFKNLDAQTNVLPVQDKVRPVSESSLSTMKGDDSDSQWEELGPVNKDEINTILTSRGPKGKSEYDYEPAGLDEFSDSDEETTPAKSENETKSNLNDESSLMQILDSWHRAKGADDKKNEATSTTSATESEEKNESPAINPTRKQKAVKSYSFVTEPDNTEDKIVHGILGSLKSSEKSTESRVSS
ncbi:hypothetical protein CDL12_00392 [Handroanthus impetiginosus]|uniref:HTH OST-type domain-containing protein n=1 Tax=Handroanthus impetiginosus TaxID=429701 RepID=A0A2G9IAR2_9LAMI|nr:hypothetical protein CDL12_00392 [Handroanthus impetiginosus]